MWRIMWNQTKPRDQARTCNAVITLAQEKYESNALAAGASTTGHVSTSQEIKQVKFPDMNVVHVGECPLLTV